MISKVNEQQTEVVFQNSSLDIFPNGIFEQLPNLKTVDISRAELQKLEFRKTVQLEWLDASCNNIQSLSSTTFANTPNLAYLYLSRNLISELSNNLFDSLKKLKVLDLSHNIIKKVNDQNLFKNQVSLEFLYLNNNFIEEFFTNLINSKDLLKLDLAYNMLMQWAFRVLDSVNLDFSYMNNTQTLLKVNGNKEGLKIDGWTSLVRLRVETNRISTISANYNKIKFVEIDDPSLNLQSLKLKGNQMNDISNITRVPTIQHLDLSDNPLLEFKENTFENMKELRYLALRKTRLVTLSSNFFSPLNRLNYFDISENWISSVDFKWFRNMFNLQNLQLEKNLIFEIKNFEGTKEILPNLETIAIARNPFECQYLIILMQLFQKIRVQMVISENMSEANQTNLRGFSCTDMGKVSKETQLQYQYHMGFPSVINPLADPNNSLHINSSTETIPSEISDSFQFPQNQLTAIMDTVKVILNITSDTQLLVQSKESNYSNVYNLLQDKFNKIDEGLNKSDHYVLAINRTIANSRIGDESTSNGLTFCTLFCAVVGTLSLIILIFIVAKVWYLRKSSYSVLQCEMANI